MLQIFGYLHARFVTTCKENFYDKVYETLIGDNVGLYHLFSGPKKYEHPAN